MNYNSPLINQKIKENNNRLLATTPIQPRYKAPDSPDEELKKEPVKSNEQMEKIKDVLRDIFYRFYVASSKRGSDMGYSSSATFNKILTYIENKQLCEVIKLNFSGKQGGLSKYLWLTPKGLKTINKLPVKAYSGGIGSKHQFIQKYYHKYLPLVGFKEVVIEKNINGKKIDLFGKFCEIKIAIEVCISTFRFEHINVIKDRDKCDFIFIVVTDKKAKKRLEDVLYKKIPKNPKLKICLIYELLNPEYVSKQVGIKEFNLTI